MLRYVISVLMLVVVTSLATPSRAAVVCYDFTGELGSHTDPWLTAAPGFPPSEFWQWQDFNSSSVVVVNKASNPTLSEALHIAGSGADWRIDLSSGGSAPTYVDFDLWVYAGTVSVDAYNSSNVKIWSNTYSATSAYSVTINPGGGIAYILIGGGDNETWLDNFCMD